MLKETGVNRVSLKRSVTVCLVILFLAGASPRKPGEWTQFRGPDGTAVSEETGLPTRWSEKENIRWKAELPGRGLSNPVISGGRIYVTACSGFQQTRLHVLCYDITDGKLLWERKLWATGGTMCHPKTNMAAPTPVTDGQRVYALFATADLACLDVEGNLVWYRSLVRDYPTITNQVGMAASPVLCKDVLIVPMENAGDSFVAGLDKLTGQNLWRVSRARDINWVTPLIVTNGDENQVLIQSRQELSAHEVKTGEKRWSYAVDGLSTIPSPVAGNGLILTPGGEFTALKPGKDPTPEVVWKENRLRTGFSSPLYYRDRVYAVNTAGVLNCADVKDGSIVWQLRLKGPFSASPVAADGKLYLVNEEGLTSVVETGAQGRTLATNDLKDTILATPAIANGAIFLRSDKYLYCISDKK